jgi:hypothetical protein
MKVAARQNFTGVWAQQGIVGHGVGLTQEDVRDVAELVEAGAEYLWLTAKTVGILHPVTVSVRVVEFAVL